MGLRHECGLSPTEFNVDSSDLEEEMAEEMAKEEEREIVLGRKKCWSVAYADDMALIANNVVGLKGTMRTLEKYLRRKGLELNVAKLEIITFRKEGGRRTKANIKWKGEEKEEVRFYNYLGYTL